MAAKRSWFNILRTSFLEKRFKGCLGRGVTALARAVGISRNYWYQLEAEAVLGGVAEETLRKVEEVLGVDFGVDFEEGEHAE